MKRIIQLLLLGLSLIISGCSFSVDFTKPDMDNLNSNYETSTEEEDLRDESINEKGDYSSPELVALYLHTYGHLPSNYITKDEAYDLGWEPSDGNLWEVTDHRSIGGDRFYNREGQLPNVSGRIYYECDVNYKGGYRGAERLVYSNDGYIYYTKDHYETFTLLYGDE